MNVNNIDLRHLRYFIAVAEELHFTRAANRLRISQPPLSMQIRQLEDALEIKLFRRLSRGVALTEAGRGFLRDAIDILDRLDRATNDARRRAVGQLGQLRVGFAGATYLSLPVTEIMLEYRTRFPEVILSPEQSNTPALIDALLNDRLDVAFIRPPVDADERLAELPIIEEKMVVAIPSGHRLAATTPLDLGEISNETLILFPREIGPGLYDTIIRALAEASVEPSIWQSAPQIMSVVPMVAAGFGIAVIPQSVGRLRLDGVVFRPIRGRSPLAKISLAMRCDDPSPLVASLLSISRRVRTKHGRARQL